MKRAFSLLEVLLAIALIALLAGSVVGFVFQLTDRRGVLLAHSRRLIGTDAMIEAIESDLFTCLAGDSRRGAGVKGDATSLRLLSRAVHLGMERSEERMKMDDLRSTEYRFDAATGAVSAARASVLFPDDGRGGGRETILEGVERLRFRYHDGQGWRESFDSAAAGGLPEAIEIGVWFAPASAGVAGAEGEEDPGSLDQIAYLEELGEPLPGEAAVEEPGLNEEALRAPDRLRIVVVPDAGDGDSGAAGPEGGAP